MRAWLNWMPVALMFLGNGPVAWAISSPAATLKCVAKDNVAEVAWSVVMEDPDGPGKFELSFTNEKITKDVETVSAFVPVFDPNNDSIQYDHGYASPNYRTMIRFFTKKKISLADYESRTADASALTCTNNLPIRTAKLEFAAAHWNTVTTDLALLKCVRTRERELTIDGDVAFLPVHFEAKVDLAKCLKSLSAVKNVKTVTPTRVDGSPVEIETLISSLQEEVKGSKVEIR